MRLLIVLMALVAIPGAADAHLSGPPRLDHLAANSSLVLVARVVSFEPDARQGTPPPHSGPGRPRASTVSFVATLEVHRVLKGASVGDGTVVRYPIDSGDFVMGQPDAGSIRLIFFTGGADGRFRFTDEDHASFSALAAAPPQAASTLDRVVAELAAFLGSAREGDEYGYGDNAVEALASVTNRRVARH